MKTSWKFASVIQFGLALFAITVAISHPAVAQKPDVGRKLPLTKPAPEKPKPEPPKPVAPELLVAPFDQKDALAARKAWGRYRQIDEQQTNSIGVKLNLIPPGRFSMGSAETAGERPAHRVTISRPFYLGQYEVTKGQFREFVNDTGYKTDAERDGKGGYGFAGSKNKPFERRASFTWQDWGIDQSDESPVVNVSHNDAVAFCQWLSKKQGKQYRLPTEAEWEYACRAGTKSLHYNGNDPEGLTKIGNVADSIFFEKFFNVRAGQNKDLSKQGSVISSSDGWAFTSPQGQFRPNSFGLYDMIGNAWEWCSDWYAEDYYTKSPEGDPTGPASGALRVFRGGSWGSTASDCRSASRDRVKPEDRSIFLGFRVARNP